MTEQAQPAGAGLGGERGLAGGAVRAGLGEAVGEDRGGGDAPCDAVGDGGFDVLGAGEDVGEVDLARDGIEIGVGGLALHRFGARVDRVQRAGEAVAAEVALGAGGDARGVGGGADQGDAARGEESGGEGGHGSDFIWRLRRGEGKGNFGPFPHTTFGPRC